MKATETTLNNFLSQPKIQYIIPVYQRNYDWTEDQCQQLFSDIIDVGQSNTTHFIGSIVYLHDGVYTSSDVKPLVIIDGQQRLTTFSILYLALYKYSKENDLDEVGDEIMDTFLSNKYVKNEQNKLKLKQSESNYKAFKFLMTNQDTSGYDEYSKIINNYNYFKSNLNQSNFELIRNGLTRLLFVEISLERGKDDPQRIFESLNSTGLELSQSDLIRNYILMGLEPDEQQRIYETYWEQIEVNARDYNNEESKVSDFIRDFLTFKNKRIPTKGSVYIEFKNKFTLRDGTFYSSLLEEIRSYSLYYSKLINPSKEPDLKIRQELDYLHRLESNVSYPFLLAVYHDYASGIISKEEFIEILKLIQSYIWRRFIVGLPTHALNKIFMSLYGDVNQKNYVKSIQKFLLKKKSYQRFPNDLEIEINLLEKDLYNIQSKNILYFLELLENYNNKEFVSIQNPNLTIEHIFPQNPDRTWADELSHDQYQLMSDKYLNTISNLTLSGNNGVLSNKSFVEKKTMNKNNGEQGYVYSRLWLNSYLKSIDSWDIETLKARFQIILDRFKKIWEFPALNIDEENDEDEDYYIYNSPDPRHRKLDYFIFRDEKVITDEVSKMYYHVIKIILEDNPILLSHTDIRNLLLLTTNKSELRTPYQINSTYYIEANIDNNSKFRKLKSLLTKLNFEDDLLINFSAKDYDSLEEEKMNRIYWEDKVGADVMKNLDKVLDSLHKIDENLKFNYTIGYIGFVVKNKVDNFLVLNPKSEWVRFSVKVKNVEHWHNVLIENGIDVISIGVNSKRLKFRIKNNSISDQMGKILDLLFESYNNR
jgi:uncharacterized protein with ParB-like and HNH nuclease domain